jgi:hypothetical protein
MSDRDERNRGEFSGGNWRRGGMQREMAGSRFGGYYARDDYDDGLGGDWTRDDPWGGTGAGGDFMGETRLGRGHAYGYGPAQSRSTWGGAGGRVSFRGRGPKNYRRGDDRILEEVNERLTDDHDVDASDIEVAVQNGEVTLSGTVNSRHEKRVAEDVAESCHGVVDVHNRLRVADREVLIGKASE